MNTMELFLAKMKGNNLPSAAINQFIHFYSQLQTGKTGFICEQEIESIDTSDIAEYNTLEKYQKSGWDFLRQTVVIKLNGGLGTTMGLQGPKSLITVKNGLSFLDITANQILNLSKQAGFSIPLILMNSFKTEYDTCNALERYPDLKNSLPQSFIQHMFPKILKSSLAPAQYPSDPKLEWNPPGHGDIFSSLSTSGVLEKLLESGYKYAFVSNIDNLGSTMDFIILGYFAQKGYSFLMEVTDRTWMDRKGGHLARYKNGNLVLREEAQCPPEEIKHFRDINRYSYFNTNNLWINLPALNELLQRNNNVLELPMIRNEKKLNPVDPNSPDVYQLESAMGTAISVFDKASAIRVPRSRFVPVKNCEELLLLWSDYYTLTDDYKIVCNPDRKNCNASINLDPEHYSRFDQLQLHFPSGAPSLKECDSLDIVGDVRFGKNVKIKGSIKISNSSRNQAIIPENTLIESDLNIREKSLGQNSSCD